MFYRQSSQRMWFFSLEPRAHQIRLRLSPNMGFVGVIRMNWIQRLYSVRPSELISVEFRFRRFVGSDRVRRSVGVGVRPELRTLLTGFGPFSEIFIQKLSVSTIWTTDDFRRLKSSKAPKVYFKSKHVKYSNITQID